MIRNTGIVVLMLTAQVALAAPGGYERGDHGFGLGRQGTTTTLMFDEFVAWLESRGLLARTPR